MEAVIHFWTTGEPGYIILLAWFLSSFTGFANMLCFSPGNLLHLARGIVIVPCVFPSHPHPSLNSEQDVSSWERAGSAGGAGQVMVCQGCR